MHECCIKILWLRTEAARGDKTSDSLWKLSIINIVLFFVEAVDHKQKVDVMLVYKVKLLFCANSFITISSKS